MIKLNFWEKFVLGTAVGMLEALAPRITNIPQKAALEAAIAFLRELLA